MKLWIYVGNIRAYYKKLMKNVTTAKEAWIIINNDWKLPRCVALGMCFCPAQHHANNRKCKCIHETHVRA